MALILARKKDEGIKFQIEGKEVRVYLHSVSKNRARLRIEAPRDVRFDRITEGEEDCPTTTTTITQHSPGV